MDTFFADRSYERGSTSDGLVAGGDRPHDFDQRQHGSWVKEVNPADFVRSVGYFGHLDYRQCAGIGRQNRRRFYDCVQYAKQLLFSSKVFDH